MKKILFIIIAITGILSAQSFKVDKVVGNVKAQIGTSEKWVEVRSGDSYDANTVLQTGKNSSVQLESKDLKFTLKESSALPLASIKKMSIDDLLLALAMEDIINAPKKKEESKSKNTAVYGAEVNGAKTPEIGSDNFGIKKLNGAVQLSESGFKESAIVTSKEAFRKYPGTEKLSNFRIYFADILKDLGLNEEAYDEFTSIKSLKLTQQQSTQVNNNLDELGKKLINKR